jgi:DNA polymerase III delta subunit
MIKVLTGDNSFEIERTLAELATGFNGQPERLDGAELTAKDLPDLLMGQSLFSTKRLVITRGLSENGEVWNKLPDYLPRLSDDIELILVEPKLDKRTATYKALKKDTEVQEFNAWSDGDHLMAESWLVKEAKQSNLVLDKKLAQLIVRRVGVDQWQLAAALEKLSLVDEVNEFVIKDLIDANPTENVFALLETAINGDGRAVHQMLATLELTEDPYRLLGLLSSQAFQLAAIGLAGPNDNPAADLKLRLPPFIIQRLKTQARSLGRSGLGKLIHALAEADADIKSSSVNPWTRIEMALLRII